MLGKEMLTTMFAYNSWANARILACATQVSREELDTPWDYGHGSLHQLIFHMLRNEWEWQHICLYHAPPAIRLSIEQFPTIAAIHAHHVAENRRLREMVASLSEDDLTATIVITWLSGKSHVKVRWQILMDLITHGMQHRSEAAVLLTRYHQSPSDLDFLFFV